MKHKGAIFLASLCIASMAVAQESAPHGTQFQVNSYTTGFQTEPDAAASPSGEVLVVWTGGKSAETDTDGSSIQARLIDSTGQLVDSDVQVNSDTTEGQNEPAVASDGSVFLVVWASEDPPGGADGVVAGRRVGLGGTPLASDFEVAQIRIGYRIEPTIATQPTGGFVVAWNDAVEERGDLGNLVAIRAQRLDAHGDLEGASFRVDAGDAFLAGGAQVASAENGSFVVAWGHTKECFVYICDLGLRARRYASDGSEVGAELTVLGPDFFDSAKLPSPGATALSSGDFVVAWSAGFDYFDRESGRGIELDPALEARRIPATGEVLGPVLAIPGSRADFNGDPAIAVAPDDTISAVLVGNGDPADGEFGSIQLQSFDIDDGASSGSQLVNTFTTSRQQLPRLASLDDGSFLVVWESRGSPGDDDIADSIQARWLEPLLFRGDFESGDATAWDDLVEGVGR